MTIVVGVDGSEQSERALSLALHYAVLGDVGVQAIMTVDADGHDEASANDVLLQAEHRLSRIVADALEASADKPSVAMEVVVGDPAVVMVDASRSADMVVLGSHGMSKLRNPVLGTVSLACIRLGSCPVLVIPAGHADPMPDALSGTR